MSPIAKNCATDVRVHYQRFADGLVLTQITAKAMHPQHAVRVAVNLNTERYTIMIQVWGRDADAHYHFLPWSSAFPHEPTLGEMIEVAESLARGEWFKLFPEEV